MIDENEKNYCTLYIIRHGETESNRNHVVMGNTGDAPLTQEGVLQAQTAAEELRHVNFDAIFSSDSPRAERTATIVRLDRAIAIRTSKALRERKYGAFEGKPSAGYIEATRHLLEEKAKLSTEEQWKFKFAGDMESDEELAERFIVELREIAVAYPGKTVLVATHGGCIRVFLMRAGYVKYGELQGGSVENAGYVKVLSDGVDFIFKEVKGVKKR